MKTPKLIILSVLTIFTISCSQKEDIKDLKAYDIVTVKEIIFLPDSTKSGEPYDFYKDGFKTIFDYCIIDGIETLIIPVKEKNDGNFNAFLYNFWTPPKKNPEDYRLAFYDISTQKEYHSIPLLGDRDIINFNYINKDSIFVFYKIGYLTDENDYEPIYFQLLNYKGESQICDYDIDISNFKDSINICTPFDIDQYQNIAIDKGNVFFSTRAGKNVTEIYFAEKQAPLFAYYDSQTKKIKLSKTITFPDISKDIYYNTHHQIIFNCLSENKLPVLRFFYSSTLYEWDYKNDKITKHNLKSRVFDSIYPLRDENSLPESLEAVYAHIVYDKNNKVYYSTLHLNEVVFGNHYNLLILADENFNYLGEMLNRGIGNNVRFYGDNIISYWYKDDSIRIQYKKLVKTERPLEPYLDSVRNVLGLEKKTKEDNIKPFMKGKNPLQEFVKSKYPEIEKDYVVLTLYASGSCPSCVDGLKEMLNRRYEVFENLPFYFIYTGLKQEIKDIDNYENISKLKIIKDSLGILKDITIKEGNFNTLDPRLTVVKDNNVVSDSIYGWRHIQSNLIPAMKEHLGIE